MVELHCVDPLLIDDFWPHVKRHIEAALKHTGLGLFEDLESDVLTGDALLWVVWKKPKIVAAVVTRVAMTEGGKVCAIHACGGSGYRDWAGTSIAGIENYARQMDCKCVRIIGRKGWVRVLPEYGITRVVLERRL